jgi:SAM-dependent methyltransferase
MSSLQERFTAIYADNVWGYGSGEGSLPVNTEGYICFLQEFMNDHGIQSVVDLGCGDWQFSHLINWGGIQYKGFDVVQSVIDRNRAHYAKPNISFDLSPTNLADLPKADLLIVKDVLQHWRDERIAEFLPSLKRYPFALITNCTGRRTLHFWKNHKRRRSRDIEDGDYRRLDLRNAPFSIKAEKVYSFSHRKDLLGRLLLKKERWRKTVLLIDNNSVGATVLTHPGRPT